MQSSCQTPKAVDRLSQRGSAWSRDPPRVPVRAPLRTMTYPPQAHPVPRRDSGLRLLGHIILRLGSLALPPAGQPEILHRVPSPTDRRLSGSETQRCMRDPVVAAATRKSQPVVDTRTVRSDLAAFRVDQHGIVHLDDSDFFYREVPRSFFSAILSARTVPDALDAFRTALASLPPVKRRGVEYYSLDPRRAIGTLLGSVGPGTLALDYGSGWGTLTRVVSALGGAVVAVDATLESLVLSKLLSGREGEIYVKGGRSLPLPFRENTFDTVMLNGVLEWLAEDNLLELPASKVQRLYLTEFLRILKPGGRILVGIENRHSGLYWAGRPEDHTALRFGAVLPRWAANLYSKRVRHKPYRTYTYTRRGYGRLFRIAGFEPPEFYVPWPRYRQSDFLLSEKTLRRVSHLIAPGSGSIRRRIVRGLARLLQRLGWLIQFVPDYYIVARKPQKESPEESSPHSLLQSVAAEFGDTLEEVAVVASRAGVLHCSGRSGVYKIPLTDFARQRIGRELAALDALRSLPAAMPLQDFVPRGSAGISGRFACYSRCDFDPVTTSAWTAKEGRAADFLRRSASDAVSTRLAETDLAKRLFTSAEHPWWTNVAGEALTTVIRTAMGRHTPVGLVHGDFDADSILISRSGSFWVIDWCWFDLRSPKFLDPLHWYVRSEVEQGKQQIAAVIRAVAEQRHSPWLDRHVWPILGELPAIEATALYLADRLVKESMSESPPMDGGYSVARDALEGYRENFAVLETLL